jgi:iron(III) transport system permease protein
VVVVTALLLSLENAARKASAQIGRRDSRTPPDRLRLTGIRQALAIVACLLPFGLGFGVPAGNLVYLALKRVGAGIPGNILAAFWHSLLLGAIGAALAVIIGYYTALRAERETRRMGRGALRLATLGYAIPGTVLALGLVAPLGWLDGALNDLSRSLFGFGPGLVLSGTLFAVIYAYLIRFLAVSHSGLEAARARRGVNVLDAARVLGGRRWRLLIEIDVPSLMPAVLAAATLVFVECIKELPATLLLRPLGVETLSTLVFQQANAELFESAALPALGIVAAGIVPVMLANHLSTRHTRR